MINEQGFTLVKNFIAKLFTILFLGLAIAILYSLFSTVVKGVISGVDITQIFLSSINTGIIALAVFELALVVHKEYSTSESENESEGNAIAGLRRTIPRFIGTVCVALSLEGLIMVIKYSQLDLAGNLYYPVAIISSTALLLTALAVFIHLTKDNEK
jgi:hypothetical protein